MAVLAVVLFTPSYLLGRAVVRHQTGWPSPCLSPCWPRSTGRATGWRLFPRHLLDEPDGTGETEWQADSLCGGEVYANLGLYDDAEKDLLRALAQSGGHAVPEGIWSARNRLPGCGGC
jgi:hypothetical protein